MSDATLFANIGSDSSKSCVLFCNSIIASVKDMPPSSAELPSSLKPADVLIVEIAVAVTNSLPSTSLTNASTSVFEANFFSFATSSDHMIGLLVPICIVEILLCAFAPLAILRNNSPCDASLGIDGLLTSVVLFNKIFCFCSVLLIIYIMYFFPYLRYLFYYSYINSLYKRKKIRFSPNLISYFLIYFIKWRTDARKLRCTYSRGRRRHWQGSSSTQGHCHTLKNSRRCS